MSNEEFEASVGMSRKWDAREAGREVAETTLDGLSNGPDFFLVFSTIHLKNHGGFQEFLNGIWDVLPENTPLIGGTLAGFINRHGCFTRGTTAVAISYPHMDVSTGLGEHTKRSPKKAGRQASLQILHGLKQSSYKQKFLFSIISGPTLPQSDRFGTMKIIKDATASKLLSKLTNISTRINQVGLGRETEVLMEISKQLMDYSLLGISTNDDNNYTNHYQFYGKKVFENAALLLGINIDLSIDIHSSFGMMSTGEKSKITGLENWNYVIKTLDNRSATDVFFEKRNLSKDIITEENIHRITPFIPVGCYHQDGTLHPYPIASFLGDYLLLGHDVVSDELEFFTASGKSLIDVVDESFNALPDDPSFVLISSCAGRLETLGREVYKVKEKITERIGDDFLVLHGLGEAKKETNKLPHLLQESFNVASFH